MFDVQYCVDVDPSDRGDALQQPLIDVSATRLFVTQAADLLE